MAKIDYAQSSDIKSRTWAQYRHDMKKKAIRELECIPLLRDLLRQEFKDPSIDVVKHGTDADLWFSPKSNLSREPDYRATFSDGRERLYEFQMAVQPDLSDYDFKLSKVSSKPRNRGRVPHTDREFFYIVRPQKKWGFFRPQWIADHSRIGPVPAWGSRQAYRVTSDVFLSELRDGGAGLCKAIQSIEERETLLEFQRCALTEERGSLGDRVEAIGVAGGAIDVRPDNLSDLFVVCQLMASIGHFPGDPGGWLERSLNVLPESASPSELAWCMFIIDFIYFQYSDRKRPYVQMDRDLMVLGVERLASEIGRFSWITPGTSTSDGDLRKMLYVVNMFEDWRQDVAVTLSGAVSSPAVRRAERIFECVPCVSDVARHIRWSQHVERVRTQEPRSLFATE